jgi:hypothetical protein
MKHSEIIRKAMTTISKGGDNDWEESPYICDNINAVAFEFERYTEEREVISKKVDEITGLIDDRINSNNTNVRKYMGVDGWLMKEIGVKYDELYDNKGNTSKELQEYRLAWMEHLAQEYEAKGM